MGNRIANFARPGSLLKLEKTEKVRAWRPVSTKPVKKMRAVNPDARHRKRDGMSKPHLLLVMRLPCCIPGCRRQPTEPHHLKSGPARQERAGGRKATDRWLVPLCSGHHRLDSDAVENTGSHNELAWFAERGIPDAVALAGRLWESTGDLDVMRRAMRS